MKPYSIVLSLCLTLLLAGCASAPGQPARKQPAPPAVAADVPSTPVALSESILEYTGKFLALSNSGQKEELARVNERLAMNRHDLNDRTKAAVIYILSDSADIRDTAKGNALLDELARENDPDLERATLVRILKNFIAEQNKMARESNRLSQKALEEQKRADALQLKLEELKNIEKNIVDRKVMDK